MTDQPTEPQAPGFWEELKRRKVVRVGVAYTVAGWVVVQVALAVFPEFGVPTWANRMVILLVALGLPVALLLAWAFELTPAGLQWTGSARRERGRQQEAEPQRQRRNRLALLVGALIPGVLVGTLVGAAGLWMWLGGGQAAPVAAPDASVVAVLPLSNLSPSPDNAFFAEGVHEEILTELSRLGNIRVISRTSVMGYGGRDHNVRQIAAELDATHIVEGSVRRAGDRVRVTAQLIDAATDQHLWAENFDRDLEDIFQVQSDVAVRIAQALGSELDGAAASSFGTRSIEAYDLYLRARSASRIPTARQDEDFAAMVELLEEAVAIDPQFVKAWGLLSEVAARRAFQAILPPEGTVEQAGRAAATVERLAPGTVEALMARAWVYYYGDRSFARALTEVQRARALAPNLTEPMELEAYLLRRLGRFDDSIARMRDILQVDPRNALLWQQLAVSLTEAGRDEEAYQSYLRVIELQPQSEIMDAVLERMRLAAYPDAAGMHALADRILALSRVGQSSQEFFDIVDFLYQVGREADGQALMELLADRFRPPQLADLEALPIDLYHRSRALEFRGQHEQALAVAEQAVAAAQALESRFEYGSSEWLRTANDITLGFMAQVIGEPEVAQAALARIREGYRSDPDYMVRRDYNYFLIEVLVASDVEQATDIFLETFGTSRSRFTLFRFIAAIHLWYPLLEDERVRELFADKPLHVRYMRDIWPHDVRPFPFDA